jgi:hypothetical protein
VLVGTLEGEGWGGAGWEGGLRGLRSLQDD